MIYQELKKFFDSKGLNQPQIAEILGVSVPYVNAVLNGTKPLGKKNAEKWANHFGLSKSYLLTGEGELLLPSPTPTPQPTNDTSSLLNTIIADKVEIIESLKRELRAKDELIASLRRELAHRPYPRNIDDSPALASESELK